MRNPLKMILLGAAATLIAANGSALAQDQQSGVEEQVRSFFDSMQQETVEAFEQADYERLLGWVENTIAEEAAFLVSNEVYDGENRKSFSVMSLDKEDMTRLGQMAVGMMSGLQGQPIQDYSLAVEVTEVTPIGQDAAAVTVEYVESGMLSPRAAGQSSGQQESDDELQTGSTQDSAQPVQELRFEATAQCNHLLRRGDGDGEMQMGLTNCQARTDIQTES